MITSNEIQYKNFLSKWNKNRIKNLDLIGYTNLENDSFIYDIEYEMKNLGSIRGGSAFKFGIFHRDKLEKKENDNKYKYTETYAWYRKYGETPEEAFFNIKSNILRVIEYAENNNLEAIEQVDLGEAYKWKIAFHYQNLSNLSVVPIFSNEALKRYLIKKGFDVTGMKMCDLQTKIKKVYDLSNFENLIECSSNIWNEYINFNIINANNEVKKTTWACNKKRNATCELKFIDYKIQEHYIRRYNRHNILEKAFKNYLENIKASNIIQDEDYIDFQFELNNQKFVCELKPSENQKEITWAIRDAVGQILGYSYDKELTKRIIIFQGKPKEKNKAFLDYLEKEHQIYYLYEGNKGNFYGNAL